jgi:hypothetical protein
MLSCKEIDNIKTYDSFFVGKIEISYNYSTCIVKFNKKTYLVAGLSYPLIDVLYSYQTENILKYLIQEGLDVWK